MPLIGDKEREILKKEFEEMTNPVKLVVFTQEFECAYCKENRQLAEELATVSDRIIVEVHNFVLDKPKVEQYQVDKIPAIVIEGAKDYGIRFYGIPAGYEFTSLVEAIKMVSLGESGLTSETKEALKKLDRMVHIQVFVTLTCPYCPMAVRLAHKLALESDYIRSDMIEASEFPHLAHKYNVFAVPKIVINEENQFQGALPEAAFVQEVLKVMP